MEAAIDEALSELGVTVIEDKLLHSWNQGEDVPEILTSLQFINLESQEITSVPCSVRTSLEDFDF